MADKQDEILKLSIEAHKLTAELVNTLDGRIVILPPAALTPPRTPAEREENIRSLLVWQVKIMQTVVASAKEARGEADAEREANKTADWVVERKPGNTARNKQDGGRPAQCETLPSSRPAAVPVGYVLIVNQKYICVLPVGRPAANAAASRRDTGRAGSTAHMRAVVPR